MRSMIISMFWAPIVLTLALVAGTALTRAQEVTAERASTAEIEAWVEELQSTDAVARETAAASLIEVG